MKSDGQQKLDRISLLPCSFFLSNYHTYTKTINKIRFENVSCGTCAERVKAINIILCFHNGTQITVNQSNLDMRRSFISGWRSEILYLYEKFVENQ